VKGCRRELGRNEQSSFKALKPRKISELSDRDLAVKNCGLVVTRQFKGAEEEKGRREVKKVRKSNLELKLKVSLVESEGAQDPIRISSSHQEGSKQSK